ncbi:hypothetical protein Tco_0124261 [Tanacetum coccineum]
MDLTHSSNLRQSRRGFQGLQRLINMVKVQLFGSQYWYDEPIATFKGRIACKVWTLKEDLMLFLRGGIKSKMIDFSSDDDFWKDQEKWEIIRWRFHESSGVHTLEIEDGTMIHMLAERRYPLSRELMIRMLDHGMESNSFGKDISNLLMVDNLPKIVW